MGEISVRAYAKINLSLDVLGVMDDGYHAIRTVFQQIGLFDTVRVRVESGGADEPPTSDIEIFLKMTGNRGYLREIPVDVNNLAVKAALLFFETIAGKAASELDESGANLIAPAADRVYIDIEKRVPSGAGLAGGSADAAATLLGLAACFGMNDGKWLGFIMGHASVLGADVPFCVMGQAYLNPELGFADALRAAPCALGEGRGDVLRAAPPLSGWALLVKPPVASSTAHVYSRLDMDEIGERPETEDLLTGLADGDVIKIASSMANVLETPALMEYPEIMAVRRALEECGGALKVMMSGSGSAVFALFKDGMDCRDAASRLCGLPEGSEVFVVPLMV